MHNQRNPNVPMLAVSRGTSSYEALRVVLFELVSSPPPEGDEVASLARSLGLSDRQVDEAVGTLAAAGLAERSGSRVHATRAALTFDTLLPARLSPPDSP